MLSLALSACSRDPQSDDLHAAVRQMDSIVHSRLLRDSVHDVDPQMRASVAAQVAMSSIIAASFPPPPGKAAYCPGDKPSQSWCVVVIGDDTARKLRIEGYGEDLAKPVQVLEMDFPPA
ncbi:hypothetical protein [Chitinimonas sp.]|uniref:hypothetical protein n=1 Tax=Chitinimonas sp. TaxID=1934313 RepID=UPI0035AE4D74